ncbi:hypothetical protein [Riemerella columbina]|uniref:hypothetical protein n=1 Tax=Riemerella columbina TaxID=103810 RepID=UPI00039DCF3A|nr:hypothetical protein [Riemerella columbina]
MKKLFLSLFVATALVSCNRDNDDPTTEQDAPLPVKFISYDHESKNDNTPESTSNLEYDGSKLIKMSKVYTVNGKTKTDHSIIKYDGNLISSIDDSDEYEQYKTDFKYDANGNLIEETTYSASNNKKSITKTIIKYAISGKTINVTSKSENYYENQLNSIEKGNLVFTLNSNKQVIKKEGTRNRTYFDYNGNPIVDSRFSTYTYTYDGKNAILKNIAGMKNLSYSEFLLDNEFVGSLENVLSESFVENNDKDETKYETKYEYTYNQKNYPISIDVFYNGNSKKARTVKVEYNK